MQRGHPRTVGVGHAFLEGNLTGCSAELRERPAERAGGVAAEVAVADFRREDGDGGGGEEGARLADGAAEAGQVVV